jgi:hypothetical protein
MKEKNERLIPEQKLLTIGRVKIDYTRISVERTLKAADQWEALQKKEFDSGYEQVKAYIGPVLQLVNIDFKPSKAFDWLKRKRITRRYILRHLDYTELSDFLEDALEPILGSKKKEQEKVDALTDAGARLVMALGPERAAQLVDEFLNRESRLQPSLPNVYPSTDGPESTGSKS